MERQKFLFNAIIMIVFQRICLAIIRPETISGKINVKATAKGLKEAFLVIISK